MNFVQTANPFGLATPPPAFLKALAAYDREIVLFPSVKEPVYRMGRRGRHGYGMLNVLKNHPDTKIYVAHKLWPLQSILPQAVGMDWNRVLLELPEYDTQRYTDPGARLDSIEAAAEAADDRKMQSELDARNTESYRLMQVMTGARVGSGVRPEGAGFRTLPSSSSGPRRRVSRPRNAGAGAMFVADRP